jgi:rhodanese-related sulfurtransferase
MTEGELAAPPARRTIHDLLAEARARLDRLKPSEAPAALLDGALLVDIRSGDVRRREGVVPGAAWFPRTVLEWRLDPASGHRAEGVGGHDRHVILMCSEGYSSSLAAATLQELGFRRATDVVGGFEAWRDAGLPVVSGEGGSPTRGE